MAKSDRIVVRLETQARQKLHAKAGALGLDDAAYVRMLIYRDVNGAAETFLRPTQADSTFRRPGPSALPESPAAEAEMPPLEELVPEDEPRAEDMEIPADADGVAPAALEDLLATAPSVLDEMLAVAGAGETHPMVAELARPARVAQRGYRTLLSSRDRGVVALGGPGSRTRAIGVNDGVVGSNNFGDGHGNVLRDNMRHFGLNGTRSR